MNSHVKRRLGRFESDMKIVRRIFLRRNKTNFELTVLAKSGQGYEVEIWRRDPFNPLWELIGRHPSDHTTRREVIADVNQFLINEENDVSTEQTA